MDIVCNLDNSYIKYCIVMLTSLFVNNKNEKFHIHIVANDLSDDKQKLLSEVVEKQYNHQLSFYLVGEGMLKFCPIDENSHISISTYYRCFLTSILPTDIDKVLYLDCDLIVCGSIKNLWDTDIDGCAVGCVEDMWSGKDEYYSRLHYTSNYGYFNAGVLLINLGYWRRKSIQEQIVEYISKYPERLLYNDQDVLNAILYNQKLFIPFRWNMQDGFFRRKKKIRKSSLLKLESERLHTVIIHFTGGKKPWQAKSVHPYRKEYFKYLDMTRWKGEYPVITYTLRIKKTINTFQGMLNLKNAYEKI